MAINTELPTVTDQGQTMVTEDAAVTGTTNDATMTMTGIATLALPTHLLVDGSLQREEDPGTASANNLHIMAAAVAVNNQ